jgi:two-component system, LytTR family, sensor kinase
LFNSLNALVSLIHSDPNKAEIFTTKLSDVYRYILINENNKLVPLSEEISFVKDYFDLQKIRDGEKINLEMKLENIDNYQIVPVSLQVLVENAIKHNSASASKPLKILIEQIKDHIQVSNNLQRKISMQDSSGTGLINLKERVKLVVNREVKITETQNDFVVQIPLKEM